jgi:hypothetical protein
MRDRKRFSRVDLYNLLSLHPTSITAIIITKLPLRWRYALSTTLVLWQASEPLPRQSLQIPSLNGWLV